MQKIKNGKYLSVLLDHFEISIFLAEFFSRKKLKPVHFSEKITILFYKMKRFILFSNKENALPDWVVHGWHICDTL